MKNNFIVVFEPRCGVDSVVDLIARHSNIRMYGQLFNRSDYALMNSLFDKGLLIRFGEDPIEFLGSKVFSDYDPDAMAIGFTLLYNHAKSESWNKVWRYARKELKVVHVKRRNLLDCFVETMPIPTYVEPAELQKAFTASKSARRENDIIFKHSEMMELEYDHILDDPILAFEDFCQFLKIPPFDEGRLVNAPLSRPQQSDKILNHEELKEHFSGKPEEEFFR